jgi:hypothetical protein
MLTLKKNLGCRKNHETMFLYNFDGIDDLENYAQGARLARRGIKSRIATKLRRLGGNADAFSTFNQAHLTPASIQIPL